MKKVAIVGAGWMTKPLVDYLMERCGYFVIVANRTPSKAEDVIAGRSGGKAVRWSTDEPRILDEVVREADLAISMVPKPVHIHVARACLRHGKHMLTTAYEIPELVALDEEARQRSNSVYLPNTVIPMLPEVLSNGVCSLQERQPRLTKSAFITYDRRGKVKKARVANTIAFSPSRTRPVKSNSNGRASRTPAERPLTKTSAPTSTCPRSSTVRRRGSVAVRFTVCR